MLKDQLVATRALAQVAMQATVLGEGRETTHSVGLCGDALVSRAVSCTNEF